VKDSSTAELMLVIIGAVHVLKSEIKRWKENTEEARQAANNNARALLRHDEHLTRCSNENLKLNGHKKELKARLCEIATALEIKPGEFTAGDLTKEIIDEIKKLEKSIAELYNKTETAKQ